MAKIVFSGDGYLDFTGIELDTTWDRSTSVYQSSTVAVIDISNPSDHTEVVFQGSGLGTYDKHGYATVGTIAKTAVVFPGLGRVDWSNLSLDAGDVEHTFRSGDTDAFISQFFGGNDTITLNAGGAQVSGYAGNDQITGKAGPDIIFGEFGDDALKGGGNSDTLCGGAGADSLLGGAATDIFIYFDALESTAGSHDLIKDLENADFIDLAAIDADAITFGNQDFTLVAAFSNAPGELVVTYDAGHDRTIIAGDRDGDGVGDLIIWARGDHHDFVNFVG